MSELTQIREPVIKELHLAEKLMRDHLASSVNLINEIGEHLIESGGKRLRMLIVLLTTKAFSPTDNYAAIQLAAVIELLHSATLLHDDVVDASELRRGNPTANKIWGEQASVLVGDYLYSRAFEIIVQVKNFAVMEILAKAANRMAEGEVQQLMNCHQTNITEADYQKVIHDKTGTLFAAAAQMGAILTNQSQEIIETMGHFGTFLGTAFQLIDDALDYQADTKELGKNIGDDLAEGKPTLPFIRALHQASAADKIILQQAIQIGKIGSLEQIQAIIAKTDAIAYTQQCANEQAQQALHYLEVLPASIYLDALIQLVNFAISRDF